MTVCHRRTCPVIAARALCVAPCSIVAFLSCRWFHCVCVFVSCRFLSVPSRGRRFASSLCRVAGKVGYMSPEVYADSPFNGLAADLWCVGVMLFVKLFGVPPFKAANPGLCPVYNAMTTMGLPLLLRSWKFTDMVSADAVDLVVAMLQPDPVRRLSFEQVVAHPWLAAYRHLFDELHATERVFVFGDQRCRGDSAGGGECEGAAADADAAACGGGAADAGSPSEAVAGAGAGAGTGAGAGSSVSCGSAVSGGSGGDGGAGTGGSDAVAGGGADPCGVVGSAGVGVGDGEVAVVVGDSPCDRTCARGAAGAGSPGLHGDKEDETRAVSCLVTDSGVGGGGMDVRGSSGDSCSTGVSDARSDDKVGGGGTVLTPVSINEHPLL